MDPNSEFLREIDELLLDSDNEENSAKLKIVSDSSKGSLPLSTSDSTTVNGVAGSCSSISASSSDSNRFSALYISHMHARFNELARRRVLMAIFRCAQSGSNKSCSERRRRGRAAEAV